MILRFLRALSGIYQLLANKWFRRETKCLSFFLLKTKSSQSSSAKDGDCEDNYYDNCYCHIRDTRKVTSQFVVGDDASCQKLFHHITLVPFALYLLPSLIMTRRPPVIILRPLFSLIDKGVTVSMLVASGTS